MASSEDVPLTALCAICHVNAIKYTCPRCGIHTCSLPCVKRHKQWAQCSGVRDPAAYRKRADLATPSSIDQDFNFITKVERSLQRADDKALDRGIHLVPAGLNRYGVPLKSKFETEVQARDIKLIRAPQGLSRQKQNKSSWKANSLMWTIEWLHYSGEQRVQNVPETKTVSDAFIALFGKRRLSMKRKRVDNDAEAQRSDVEPRDNTREPRHDPAVHQKDEIARQDANSSSIGAHGAPREMKETQQIFDGLNFYLHRPQTSSKLKCLIPIAATSRIKDTLNGRTLLEFPTVYIREEKPDELPEPFILEREYLDKHGQDVMVMHRAEPESTNEADSLSATLDSKKILEVLKQDLTG